MDAIEGRSENDDGDLNACLNIPVEEMIRNFYIENNANGIRVYSPLTMFIFTAVITIKRN